MQNGKPKGYFPKGHIGDGDSFLRFIGCSSLFLIFILVIVVLQFV